MSESFGRVSRVLGLPISDDDLQKNLIFQRGAVQEDGSRLMAARYRLPEGMRLETIGVVVLGWRRVPSWANEFVLSPCFYKRNDYPHEIHFTPKQWFDICFKMFKLCSTWIKEDNITMICQDTSSSTDRWEEEGRLLDYFPGFGNGLIPLFFQEERFVKHEVPGIWIYKPAVRLICQACSHRKDKDDDLVECDFCNNLVCYACVSIKKEYFFIHHCPACEGKHKQWIEDHYI